MDGTITRPKVYVQWGGASELSNYDDSCRTTVDVASRADVHISVDPRMANMGKEADYWQHLRPGTDGALALGFIHVMLRDGLYDKDFVEKWTHGFDELSGYVQEFTPERVEEITWFPLRSSRRPCASSARTRPRRWCPARPARATPPTWATSSARCTRSSR